MCFGLSVLGCAPAAFAEPGEIDASWNSGRNDQGNVAFWIRGKGGSCEEQKSALPLVFGTRNLKAGASTGPLQVKDLAYCFLFLNSREDLKDPEGGTSSCTTGSVEFSYDAATNEYRGKYDLTMKNKAVRRGDFRAQLCKPPEPEKK
ncbi:MAG TPA: hypothetical protein VM140_13880 [Burkholderiales bacterium]|nr:hypothetical protein [Burkholderiales bacterium]